MSVVSRIVPKLKTYGTPMRMIASLLAFAVIERYAKHFDLHGTSRLQVISLKKFTLFM